MMLSMLDALGQQQMPSHVHGCPRSTVWDMDLSQKGQCPVPLWSPVLCQVTTGSHGPTAPQGTTGPQGHSQNMGALGQRQIKVFGAVTGIRNGL